MMSSSALAFRSVRRTADFERIAALPRRRWDAEVGATEALVQALTEKLKAEDGTMRLRPIQAHALSELATMGGLFAPIRVGGGKTLISLLAPLMVGAQKPLILLPATLIRKTRAEFDAFADDWQVPPQITIVSYESLGRLSGEAILAETAPDFIIADECHKLKNTAAAVTRRVARYLRQHPETKVLAMSGTHTKRSIRDFWHSLKWCLGDKAPIPLSWPEMSDWADAIDEDVQPLQRSKPGVLLSLCPAQGDGELVIATRLQSQLEEARLAYQRRLCETPGVVATAQPLRGPKIEIRTRSYPLSPALQKAFTKLRGMWETPDGQPLSDAVSLWRHARELACGFFYRWNPCPPQEWLYARRAWCSYVRQVIHNRRHSLDSELAVAKACTDGRLAPDIYTRWKLAKATFEPSREPIWIDDAALKLATAWLGANDGIAWVEHRAFGQRLAQLTDLPYFGAGGLGCDSSGNKIPIEQASGPVIASIAANGAGRNIQQWSKNLVLSCPPNGAQWEQLIGRTHRDGQLADSVTFDVLLACDEQRKGFEQALADANYIEQTTGQPQKLLTASIDHKPHTESQSHDKRI